jgi:hypothetical protein
MFDTTDNLIYEERDGIAIVAINRPIRKYPD